MTITPSKLRDNLYNTLDEVIATGKSVDIARNGHILHIVVDKKTSRLSNITPKTITNSSDEELINTNWQAEWKAFI